jgi:hypothetical protein
MKIRIVEKENVKMDYGMTGINAVIDHPEHGRLFISDGFGGVGTMQGGCVRWTHGMAIKLKSDDTLEKIKSLPWNDFIGNFEAMLEGYDNERPVMEWSGHIIESVAKSAGL